MAISKEQEQALALARARRRKVESATEQQGVGGAMPFFNKAIAGIAGAPVDITNAILGGLGLPVSDKPLGGSESIRAGMGKVGIETPDREPETTGEFIGQVGGEAAGFLAPMAKLAQVGQKGTGTLGGLSRGFTRELVERPGRSAAIEVGGVAGAGSARSATSDGDLGAGEQMLAETIGGLGGAGAAGMGATMMRLAPSVLTGKAIKSALFPFTKQGGFERASRRLQELVPDAKAAIANIDDLKGSALLPSARTGEPGLMALEKVVLSRDPAEVSRVSVKYAEAVQELATKIRGSGDVKTTKEFIKRKRERLVAALDARVEAAGNDAALALGKLDPNITPADASLIVRESIEQSLADARVQEGFLWSAIPQDAPVPVRATKAALESLENTLSTAQRGDMPEIARNIINNFGIDNPGFETVRELDGLYKKLGEIGRAARAAGERNRARLTDDLRDAILVDIGNAKGGVDVKEAIDTARGFSRELNRKFQRGNVGRILGYSREGGVATPESLTLEQSVGRRGEKGALAARQIAEATADDPLALEGVQNYLKGRFVRDTIRNGQFSPAAAETFMRQNEELLNMFPVLRDQLEVARSADDVFRRVKKSSDAKRKALDRKEISAAATFLGAPVSDSMGKVMASNDPVNMMGELVKMTRDNIPARRGLKSGFTQWLVDSAISQGQPDILGRQMVYGLKIQNQLADPTVQGVMQKLYSKDEIKDITRSVKELAMFDRQNRAKASGKIIADTPNWILARVVQVLGARAGTRLSASGGNAGVSLQAARMGSSEAKRLLQGLTADKAEQLLIDAIEDPLLMKALLANQDFRDRRVIAKYDRVLRSYFASHGSRLFGDESEQDSDQ